MYLFQVIIESSPSVLRLSFIENPRLFGQNQLVVELVRFEKVDFGKDGFLGVHAKLLIDTMLKRITAASFSEAGSNLQVIS